jgi:hypothetical protein
MIEKILFWLYPLVLVFGIIFTLIELIKDLI